MFLSSSIFDPSILYEVVSVAVVVVVFVLVNNTLKRLSICVVVNVDGGGGGTDVATVDVDDGMVDTGGVVGIVVVATMMEKVKIGVDSSSPST